MSNWKICCFTGLILFCLIVATPAWALKDWQDLLSDEFDECNDNAGNTIEFGNCAGEERKRQTALLNEVYARLIDWMEKTGNKAAIPLLEESQRAWEEYVNMEGAYIAGEDGTIWGPLASKWKAALTILRIREFEQIMSPTSNGLGAWQTVNSH